MISDRAAKSPVSPNGILKQTTSAAHDIKEGLPIADGASVLAHETVALVVI